MDQIHTEYLSLKAVPIAVNAVSDHVHLLIRFPATITVCDLVKQVKGASSRRTGIRSAKAFKWQGGYGAFTVAKRHVLKIKAYIDNQEKHHREFRLHEELERCWAENDDTSAA